MAKSKELTVEEKLRSLYRLQLIDSRIDTIKSVRGELPLEVEDLEDEVAGLNTRLNNFKEDVANLESDISNKKILLKKLRRVPKNTKSSNKQFETTVNLIL